MGYGSRGEPSIFDSSRNIVDDGIPVEDAAVLLLFAHAFDIAGIKSTPKGALGRKGKQYPKRGLVGVGWCGAQTSDVLEGSSLFETIMLNLALRSRDGHEVNCNSV